jgi:hypothetical protein
MQVALGSRAEACYLPSSAKAGSDLGEYPGDIGIRFELAEGTESPYGEE